MIPLKIKFWRIENAICMKVLQQDESTRSKGKLFVSLNGISVFSNGYPRLFADAIFLRGSTKEWDDTVISTAYEDVSKAKEYLSKYIEAIKEYNKSIATADTTDIEESDTETIIAE